MKLLNIILHQIQKDEDGAPSLNLSDHLLPKNETTIEFIEMLIKSYSSKNPTYGTFQEDEELYPFQKRVREYIDNKDFLNFSIESMKILKKEINVNKATGGYIVFAHYEEKTIEYLVTIMLDKSVQFTVDDRNLDIEKLKGLDIDKLARANRINIPKWIAGEELYLSFIKGTREVSAYFQKFIGNTDLTSAKKNATNLKTALYQYMRDNNYDYERRSRVMSDLLNYTENQVSNDEDIKLESISAIINFEKITDFIEYVQIKEDLEVSGSFRAKSKNDFNFLHQVTIKEKGYKLEFEKELIKSGKIEKVDNKIIINDVPDEILDNELSIN